MMTLMMDGDYNGMMGGGYGWMMAWMLIWFLVAIALVAVAVFAVVRFSGPRTKSRDAALSELRRRYAAGELDDDEYRRRRAGLEE